MAMIDYKTGIVLIVMLIYSINGQIDDDPLINQLEEDSANYLHNVMNKIQQEKEEVQSVEVLESEMNMDTYRQGMISGPTPLPPIHQGTQNLNPGNPGNPGQHVELDVHAMAHPPAHPPAPPALSADQLNAIYKAAIMKGATVSELHKAQLGHIGDAHKVVQPASHGIAESMPGYYYYFYPVNSFADGNSTDMGEDLMMAAHPDDMSGEKPPPGKKAVEPLFMAVTGFMGMAMMFIVSVLFLPKFHKLRIEEFGPESKENPHDLAVLGKLLFESMDGKDCTERMACELGRIVRSMRMGKAVKIMEILLPPNASRQVSMIRKAAVKKEKCNFIPCRFTTNRPPAKQAMAKPWKKGTTPHDIWMKQFEKHDKNAKKKPNNVWNKKT